MFTIMGTTIEATGDLAMTVITTAADPSKVRWRVVMPGPAARIGSGEGFRGRSSTIWISDWP